jgi:hypothetical protein
MRAEVGQLDRAERPDGPRPVIVMETLTGSTVEHLVTATRVGHQGAAQCLNCVPIVRVLKARAKRRNIVVAEPHGPIVAPLDS